MGRQLRQDFQGAWHHVMHRGARRAPIFLNDDHCFLFLDLLENTIEQFEVEIHGFSLMPNHYHLLLRSRHGNLSEAMQYLNGTYTRQVNAMHQWDGPLFKGRYTSKLITDEPALPYVLAYIHLGPLRANLVTRIDSKSWTSLRGYLGRKGEPKWLTTDYFIRLFGDGAALQRYTLSLHRGGQAWPETMDLEHGFFHDGRTRIPAVVRNDFTNESRFLPPEKVIALVCKVTGAKRKEIERSVMGPRANPARRFATWALRKYTRLRNREIGALIHMSYNQVSNVLTRRRQEEGLMDSWIEELSRHVTNDGA